MKSQTKQLEQQQLKKKKTEISSQKNTKEVNFERAKKKKRTKMKMKKS